MECKSFERIESILRHAATALLDKRKNLRAHSQPVGKHTFFVIDEYPAIVAERPDVAKYVGKLLREGGKYRLHLVIASQDFQVKTIDPSDKTGGAIRDNFDTCLYVGGDTTTARELLDVTIPRTVETTLGKGPIYLRSQTHKQASLALTPWCDNEALYTLLGPSTYEPQRTTDELNEEDLLDSEVEQEDDNDPFASIHLHHQDAATRVAYDEPPQNTLKNRDTDPYARSVYARSNGTETAPENDVRGQSAAYVDVAPEGWTLRHTETLPGIYEVVESIDKSLRALKLSTTPKNREYAKMLLKQQGLWKDEK
jgi:hypothetical protein